MSDPIEGEPAVPETMERLRRFRRLLLGLTLVHPIAWLLSRWVWIADLLTHFQEPAAIVTALATLLYLFRDRRFRIFAPLLALLAAQVFSIVRYDFSSPVVEDRSSKDRLRILFANIYVHNDNLERLTALIEREKPDIIALVEYAQSISDQAIIKRDYPFSVQRPSIVDAGGIGLWFRHPPQSLELLDNLPSRAWPSAHARFDFAGRTRELWVVHPFPPLPGHHGRDNARELAEISQAVGSSAGSRILMGDLNATDGSAHFRDLLRSARLRDSRQGFGRQRSWPVESIYRIAIDHLLLSDDLAVVDRRLGPAVGSDHFPLIVDLAPAAMAGDPVFDPDKASMIDASQKSKLATKSSSP